MKASKVWGLGAGFWGGFFFFLLKSSFSVPPVTESSRSLSGPFGSPWRSLTSQQPDTRRPTSPRSPNRRLRTPTPPPPPQAQI